MERRANSRGAGFSLIEVVVALAIVAIIAGAMAPLALKALNQARERRTRDELKAGYEAIFGARDRRVANMRSDFGYTGAGALRQMTAAGGVRAYGPYASQPALTGGWNGPYWTGSQDANGFPVDAWGRRYQLRAIAGGYQLISLGANGVLESPTAAPQGDDLVYPTTPIPLPVTTLQVNLHQVSGGSGGGSGGGSNGNGGGNGGGTGGGAGGGQPPANGSVTVYAPSATAAPLALALAQASPGLFYSSAVPSGPVIVSASVPGYTPQSQAVNLLQGGTVTLDFYF